MDTKLNTEIVIDNLVAAACGENASAQARHVYREALRGLVRLAKSEQMLEIKTSVDKLTGPAVARAARRRAKAILLAQRLKGSPQSGKQQQLEFNRR